MASELEVVRAMLVAGRHGTLCTAHHTHGGWPFGSVTTYALTADGDPVFLLSAIAEHTRNLRADARASLVVQDASAVGDPLAGARATWMGRADVPTGDARRDAVDRYVARCPSAASWARAHDFDPWVLRVERVRWILGFGAMGWFDGARWRELR